MLLKELKLQNFRQYREETIEFHPGITAIVGDNGSGKTTLLEAIIWCLYGEARVANKTIPNYWSSEGEPSSVELRFELDGQEYLVQRSLRKNSSTAKVLDSDGKSLATTVTEVNRFVEHRLLRMTYEQFSNSFCTEQKQLDFLKFRSQSDKKDEIAKMLGYTRLRVAQELANKKAKEAKNKIEGSEAILSLAENAEKERKNAEEHYLKEKKAREESEKKFRDVASRLNDYLPLANAAREFIEIEKELEQRKDVEEHLEKELSKIKEEITSLENRKRERDELKPYAVRYHSLERELNSLIEEQKEFQERLKTQSRFEQCEKHLEDTRERLKRLEPLLLDKLEKECKESNLRISQLGKEIELLGKKWQEEKEEARKLFEKKRHELESLKKEQMILDESVKEGKCPTCGQKLREGRLPRALEIERQIPKILAECESLKKDLERREIEPQEYKAKKADLTNEQANYQALEERRFEEAKKDGTAKELRNKEKELLKEIASLQKLIERFPATFDENRIHRVQEELKSLQPKWRHFTENANIEEQLTNLKHKLQSANKNLEEEKKRREEKIRRQQELGMNKTEAEKILSREEDLKEEHRRVQMETTAAKTREETARERLERAIEHLKEYERIKQEVEGWKKERLLYTEVAKAFDGLYLNLAFRTRELLGEFASEYIASLSKGRYTSLGLDENYMPELKDEFKNEEVIKNVISGGETDLVLLSLRLALADLIQENSGRMMSLLILDEVFGSLDNTRRENVMQQLNALRERYEQILVISHIDAINDAADRSLIVTFDPEEHTSKIEEKVEVAMLL